MVICSLNGIEEEEMEEVVVDVGMRERAGHLLATGPPAPVPFSYPGM